MIDGLVVISKNTDSTNDNAGSKNAAASAAAFLQEAAQSRNAEKLSPREQRRAEEAEQFRSAFEKSNVTLEPFKDGWGPYQALNQMAREHKIDMTPEQIRKEAIRIRDRDFHDLGRNYYTTKDQISFWSPKEISEQVQKLSSNIKGIDVSSYEDVYDWKQVKDAGYDFAFLRATKGRDFVDPTFEKYREGAHAAGLKVGYYHFLKPQDSIDEQVKSFVKTVGKVGDEERVVVDLESKDSRWADVPQEKRVQLMEDWIAGVKKALGTDINVMVYSGPSFVNDTLKNDPRLGKYDLWIANYRAANPKIPKPWTSYKIWQYSDKSNIPGIRGGSADLDMYNGTEWNK